MDTGRSIPLLLATQANQLWSWEITNLAFPSSSAQSKMLVPFAKPFIASRDFVNNWYNHDHHPSGIGLLTPAMLHYGQAEAVTQQRQQVLQAAYCAHPERFVKGLPLPPVSYPGVD